MRERMYRNAAAASPKNYLSRRSETAHSPHLLWDVGADKQAKVDASRKHAEPYYLKATDFAGRIERAL
jgi:hypothetical protein